VTVLAPDYLNGPANGGGADQIGEIDPPDEKAVMNDAKRPRWSILSPTSFGGSPHGRRGVLGSAQFVTLLTTMYSNPDINCQHNSVDISTVAGEGSALARSRRGAGKVVSTG